MENVYLAPLKLIETNMLVDLLNTGNHNFMSSSLLMLQLLWSLDYVVSIQTVLTINDQCFFVTK